MSGDKGAMLTAAAVTINMQLLYTFNGETKTSGTFVQPFKVHFLRVPTGRDTETTCFFYKAAFLARLSVITLKSCDVSWHKFSVPC